MKFNRTRSVNLDLTLINLLRRCAQAPQVAMMIEYKAKRNFPEIRVL